VEKTGSDMAIYLRDATYVDWKTLKFRKNHLAIQAGRGGAISFPESIPAPEELSEKDLILDCQEKIVTKSFVCGHHHIYSTLARGMPAPLISPKNFHEILRYVWWRLDKLLDTEMIRASALAAAMACAKNGVTFIIDHHASPSAVENSLETIARAFDEIGVGHLLCYELSERDGEEVKGKGLAETAGYLRSGRQGQVGLHASFTVGDDLLRKAVDLAAKYGAGIHVHVAEDGIDQERCLQEHGQRVIKRYRDAGLLELKGSIFAHCLHLDDRERRLLRESPVTIAQNAESNLNNNVGDFASRGLGAQIMLGTDGMHGDMLRSAKAAFLVGQRTEGISFSGIYERFRKAHGYLDENRFSGDGENNLVILDYDSPTEIREENFLGHFIYGIESRHVESVISSGRLIVQGGKLLTTDEGEILKFAREMGNKLWAKMRQ
jgi:cytosine/adenosine deaminase-related metal-dependent hydrolase